MGQARRPPQYRDGMPFEVMVDKSFVQVFYCVPVNNILQYIIQIIIIIRRRRRRRSRRIRITRRIIRITIIIIIIVIAIMRNCSRHC